MKKIKQKLAKLALKFIRKEINDELNKEKPLNLNLSKFEIVTLKKVFDMPNLMDKFKGGFKGIDERTIQDCKNSLAKDVIKVMEV